jgi:recombination protein RecR
MEGYTKNYYLFYRLGMYEIVLTTLASGVAVGDELEYTDEVTLGRAINNRNPYNI